MEQLDRATAVFAQVLAEQPEPPRTSFLPDWLPAGLGRFIRLVSSHESKPDLSEYRQRLAKWGDRYEAAARDLLRADQERRALIDAFVALPDEAVSELLEIAHAFGKTPLHPLLKLTDLAPAERLFASLIEHPERLDLLRRLAAGQKPSREEHERLAETLYREVITRPRSLPKGFPPVELDPGARAAARRLADRVVEVRDRVKTTVDAVRAATSQAKSDRARRAARNVGAQVLYAELAGKEALLEARKVESQRSRVVDVAWTASGLERRLLVDGGADLVKVAPVRAAPEPVVARWRETLQRAKGEVARAQVGLLAVETATPTQRMVLDRDALGRRLTAVADAVAPGQPALLKSFQAIRDLPALRAEADRLTVKAAEVQSPGTATARATRQNVEQELARLRGVAAPKEQEAASVALQNAQVRSELRGWKSAADAALGQQMQLAQSPPARQEELNRVRVSDDRFTGALQRRALPLLPGPRDVSEEMRIVSTAPQPPPRPTAAQPRQGGESQTPSEAPHWLKYPQKSFETDEAYKKRMLAEHPDELVVDENGQLRRKTTPEMQDERRQKMPAPPPRVVVPGPASPSPVPPPRVVAPGSQSAPPGSKPAGGGGWQIGAVTTWEEIEQRLAARQQAVQQGVGSGGGWQIGGVVSRRELEQRFAAQQEASMRAAEKATQERIAKAKAEGKTVSFYGAVHRRSDLANPDYVRTLWLARMGGWGWTHKFADEEELRKFVESRLGHIPGVAALVHKRSDLQDPAYMERLFRSRIGGFGWTHTFKNQEEYRDFIQSRLGGFGRAYTCNDLKRLGWKPEQVKQIFDNAQKYGKKNFETDEAYQKRMLAEHPDEFKVDENGQFRRKTTREMQDERRQKMLASGKYIEDPDTGNLVPKESKRGRDLVEAERARNTTTVELKLADGRTIQVTTEKNQSLWDALTDTLRGQGYSRDASGNWHDAQGRVILAAEKALEYDQRYVAAKKKTDPDFDKHVTYKPSELEIPPPPTPAQELAKLKDDIKKSLGYEIRNIEVGGKKVDVQVKPGQSPSDALLEQLKAEGRKVAYDDFGNIIDQDTRKVVVPWGETTRLNREYDKKVTEAVFGEGNEGYTKEVEWLAKNGTPEQRARAQEIIQQMTQRVGELKETVKRQQELAAKLDTLGDRSGLRAAERAEYDKLFKELERVTAQRKDIEQGIIDGSRAANESAKQVVERSLSYREREALQANADGNRLAGEIKEIDRRLREEALGPTARHNLEAQRARRVEELIRAERKQEQQYAELRKDRKTAAVDALGTAIDRAGIGLPTNTVLNRGEAVARARGTKSDPENPRVAYAVDEFGRPLLDPTGKPIRLTPGEAQGVERRVKQEREAQAKAAEKAEGQLARTLAVQQPLIEATAKRVREVDEKVANYDRTLAGIPDTPQNRQRREQLEAAKQKLLASSRADRERLKDYAEGFDRLSSQGQKEYAETAERLRLAREKREKEHLEAEYAVEYVDADGKVHRWQSERQKQYQKAQREKKEAEEAKALAEREAKEAARAKETAAAAAAARKKTEAEAQQQREAERLQAEAARREREARQADLNAQATTAEAKRREAEALLERARRENTGLNTEETRAKLSQAETELKRAKQAELVSRLQASAALSDPGLFNNLAAQEQAIRQQGAAVATLEGVAQEAKQRYEAMARDPGASKDQVAAARARYESALVESERARHKLTDARGTLDKLVDNGLYALATPEANAARLDEFKQRERENRAAGRFAYAGFTDEEQREYFRRGTLDEYHQQVTAATTRADRLRALSDRRDRNEPLSAAETKELEAGLTAQELAVIRGERERRQRLESLQGETDLGAKAQDQVRLEEWMRATVGGPARRELTAQERELEQKLGRSPSANDRVARTLSEWEVERFHEQEQERAQREAEAARYREQVVAPALAKNREIDQKLKDFDEKAQRAREDREQRIKTLQQELEVARQTGQTSPDIQQKERLLHEAIIGNMDLDKREQQTRRLAGEVASFDQQIRVLRDQIRRNTVDKDDAEAKIKSLEEGKTRRVAELRDYQTVPNAAFQNQQARQAIDAQRPPEWSYDPGAREREQWARTQRALAATTERAQLEQVSTAALDAAGAQVEAAKKALEDKQQELRKQGIVPDATGLHWVFSKTPSAADQKQLDELAQKAKDAEQGLNQLKASYDRRLDTARKDEYAEFSRNARDRIGPNDTYDLKKAVASVGIDLERETRADDEWKRRAVTGATHQVDIAQREKITAEGPSLLAETVRQIEWKNLADPRWVAKTVVNSELGALRAVKDFAVETVKGAAALGYEGARLAVSGEARQELAQKVVSAYDTLDQMGGAGVSRAVTNALGEAGSAYMKSLVKPDGTIDESKIAGDAGYAAMMAYLNWKSLPAVGPEGRMISAEKLVAEAAEASRRANLGFAGRRIEDLNALGKWAKGADEALNTGLAVVRENPGGVLRQSLGVAKEFAKADVVQSWGNLKAGYGALDSTKTVADAANKTRTEAIAKAFKALGGATSDIPAAPGRLAGAVPEAPAGARPPAPGLAEPRAPPGVRPGEVPPPAAGAPRPQAPALVSEARELGGPVPEPPRRSLDFESPPARPVPTAEPAPRLGSLTSEPSPARPGAGRPAPDAPRSPPAVARPVSEPSSPPIGPPPERSPVIARGQPEPSPTPRIDSPELPRTPTPRPAEAPAKPTIEPPRRAAEPQVGEPVGPRRPDVEVPPQRPRPVEPVAKPPAEPPRVAEPRPVEPPAKPTIEPPRRVAESGAGEPVGPRRPDVEVPARPQPGVEPAPVRPQPTIEPPRVAAEPRVPDPAVPRRPDVEVPARPRPGREGTTPREPAFETPGARLSPDDPARLGQRQRAGAPAETPRAPDFQPPGDRMSPAPPPPEPGGAPRVAARPEPQLERRPEPTPRLRRDELPDYETTVISPPKGLSREPRATGPFTERVVKEEPRHILDELVDAKVVARDARGWLGDELPELERKAAGLRSEASALEAQLTKLPKPAARAAVEARLNQIRTEMKAITAGIAEKRPASAAAIRRLESATQRLEGTKVPIRDASGTVREVEMGPYIGGGVNGHVFRVKGEPGRAVKLFTDRGTSPLDLAESIKGQLDGARALERMDPATRVPFKPLGRVQRLRLGEHEIAVLPMERVRETPASVGVGKGRRAWDTLPPGSEYRVDFDARRREFVQGKLKTLLNREEQRALLDMHANLAKDGVVCMDCHLGNVYFIRTPSGLQVGILDTDRLGRLSEANAYLEQWLLQAFGDIKQGVMPDGKVRSMFQVRPDGRLMAQDTGWTGPDKDAGWVMRKMLEHRGYIRYNNATGQYEMGLIDPELAKKYFPEIVPAKKAPGTSFWLRPGSGFAAVSPPRLERRAA